MIESGIKWLSQLSTTEIAIAVSAVVPCALLAIKRAYPYALTHFANRFPLLGRIDRNAKNFKVNGNFFQSEDELLSAYKEKYKRTLGDATYFHQCQQYLQMAGEHGRTPTPKWKLATLFLGNVLVTSLFTPLLMPYLNANMSDPVQLITGGIITFVISVIFLSITYQAGKEQYRNAIINRLFHDWTNDDSDNREPLVMNTGLGIGTIESPSDLCKPNYQQVLNRLKISSINTSNVFKTSTALISAMLVATTVMIYFDASQTKNAEVCDWSQVHLPLNELTLTTGNQLQTLAKECVSGGSGTWLSAIVLLGFLMLQLLAYSTAKSHGFLSALGVKAYRFTKRYQSLSDFILDHRTRRDRVIQAANSDLQKLHRKMERHVPTKGLLAQQLQVFNTKHTRNFQRYLVQSPHDLLEHPDFVELMLQLSPQEIQTIEKWVMAKYKLMYDQSNDEDAFARVMVYRDDIRALAVQLTND